MTLTDTTLRAPGRALLEHLRDPMRRSSYALIIGTGLTSALGLVFWALAARWLPPATVGIGASLVTVMVLLANLSTLGLRNGLVRFLPSAGRASRRLIATSYAACAGAAVVVSLVFLAGRGWFASKLDLLASPPAAAAFVLATVVWVLFVLQDHVLVGLRSTGWVPVANGLSSVVKIALLPLTAALAGWAIFAATAVSAALAVLGVTLVIWRVTAPQPADHLDVAAASPISVPKLVRFAVTDHLTAVLWMSATNLVMLMVLQQAGAEASAHYFLATTIGFTLYLVISNVGSALVAESARFPDRAVALARQALGNAARLVIPLAIAGCLLAPLLLSLLGRSYAEHATLLLQLVLLSAVPQLIIGIALSTARVRNDLRTIIAVYSTIAVGDLGGTWIGLQVAGLTGVGVALLVTVTLVAAGLLLTGRTGLWSDRRGGRSLLRGALGQLTALRGGSNRRWARREAAARLAPALDACGRPAPATSYRVLPTECDTVVVLVDDGPDAAIVKIAVSPAASQGLQRHAAALVELGDLPDSSLPASSLPYSTLQALLPRLLGRGTVDGCNTIVETRLPGAPLAVPDEPASAAAFRAVARLHAHTAVRRTVTEQQLTEWVDQPVDVLSSAPSLRRSGPALEHLRTTLRTALCGVEVLTTATHGDFWPGNVLVAGESTAAVRVTGLVDWENARRVALPDTDFLHWWLSVQPGELGAAVRAVLLDAAGTGMSRADLPLLPNAHVDLEHLVLLTWLWHVSDGLRRASRHPVSRVWIARNVTPVLRLFRRGER